MKQLKLKISHLNQLIASLGRNQKPETQSEEIVILTSTPIQPSEFRNEIEEIRQLWDESDKSWGEINQCFFLK